MGTSVCVNARTNSHAHTHVCARTNSHTQLTRGLFVLGLRNTFVCVKLMTPFVAVNEKIGVARSPPGEGVEKQIGTFIAENLVDNGATLQMGIGGIPDACLAALKGAQGPRHPLRDVLGRRHGTVRQRRHHEREEAA